MNVLRQAVGCTAIILAITSAATTATDYRDWSNVIRRNKNATVLIRIESGGDSSYGSGVVVTPDGCVLTAKHILPEPSTLSTAYLTALIGWEPASIDFSKARQLRTVYVSPNHDFAVLRFAPPPPSVTFASIDSNIEAGIPLLVMAYPSGGALQSTPGIVSGHGPGGTFTTSAVVGSGDSGGPVFGTNGAMTGILLEGTVRDAKGTVELGYLLSAAAIQQDLTVHQPDIHLTVGSPHAIGLVPLERLSISYSLDDEKTDHPSLTPSSDARERTFYAENGYRIISVSFRENSRNHADHPQLTISSDGSSFTAKYTITSGPIFDQWRGWIVGSIVTQQERR